jgi:hypothetical protein
MCWYKAEIFGIGKSAALGWKRKERFNQKQETAASTGLAAYLYIVAKPNGKVRSMLQAALVKKWYGTEFSFGIFRFVLSVKSCIFFVATNFLTFYIMHADEV